MIKYTSEESATQRAQWIADYADGAHRDRFMAAVTRSSRTDDRGATGWAWELQFPADPSITTHPDDMIMIHYTGATDGDLIYAPDMGDGVRALDVLLTLATFLSAWQEARPYGEESDSENNDLFPNSVVGFMPAIDDFYIDVDYFMNWRDEEGED